MPEPMILRDFDPDTYDATLRVQDDGGVQTPRVLVSLGGVGRALLLDPAEALRLRVWLDQWLAREE